MTVAGFIAAQRTDHGVPHTVACRALEVSESWFYKWSGRPAGQLLRLALHGEGVEHVPGDAPAHLLPFAVLGRR